MAAIATPPVAMRARLCQNMVLTAPSTERPLARQYIGYLLGERSNNITIPHDAEQGTSASEVIGGY